MPVEHAQRIASLLEWVICLLALLEQKSLSINRLRQICFGATTESARNLCGKKIPKDKAKARGHGRNSHRQYTGAQRVRVAHPTLRAGQRCPDCLKGKVRPVKEPAVAIAVTAQPPVGALRQQTQSQEKPKRTGIFTSGINGEVEGRCVNLFFTGRDHAGENLAAVLDLREPHRAPPLHMCDGLARNVPKGHRTVDCQCNVHARRNFVELEGSFPEECRKVVESFSQIYRVEAQAKAAGLGAQERLRVHQLHSQPVMEALRAWFTEWVEGKKVEPNSGLGQAIAYMQVRWTELTQFLRIPGAPIDNNKAERILKMVFLHRKNSLFCRTQRGADVGDLFMSLVQTCRSNGVNTFHYLMAVVRNAARAKVHPGAWMPWNYHAALAEPDALSP